MASVQELILAAQQAQQAKRSPLIDLVNQGISGYDAGQASRSRALDNNIKLLQIQQAQQQAVAQAQMQQEIAAKMQAQNKAQTDAAVAQGINSVKSPTPVLPVQKFKEKITQDAKGQYSRSFEVVEPKDVSYQKAEYQGADGKAHIGRFNPGTGQVEQNPNDPLAPPTNTSTPSATFAGMQNGRPVLFNPKTTQFSYGQLPGQGPLTAPNQTEGQANASIYGTRAEQAGSQIDKLSKRTDFTSASAALQSKAPNFAKSADVQSLEQAKRNFLNAILRRESGATISPFEREDGDKQYFPVFGDKPDVLAQKAQNRATAIAGLKSAAGQVAPAPAEKTSPNARPANPTITPADVEAVQWARANLNDPRAKEILRINGVEE
jgi:hypothetical protein